MYDYQPIDRFGTTDKMGQFWPNCRIHKCLFSFCSARMCVVGAFIRYLCGNPSTDSCLSNRQVAIRTAHIERSTPFDPESSTYIHTHTYTQKTSSCSTEGSKWLRPASKSPSTRPPRVTVFFYSEELQQHYHRKTTTTTTTVKINDIPVCSKFVFWSKWFSR